MRDHRCRHMSPAPVANGRRPAPHGAVWCVALYAESYSGRSCSPAQWRAVMAERSVRSPGVVALVGLSWSSVGAMPRRCAVRCRVLRGRRSREYMLPVPRKNTLGRRNHPQVEECGATFQRNRVMAVEQHIVATTTSSHRQVTRAESDMSAAPASMPLRDTPATTAIGSGESCGVTAPVSGIRL